MKSKKQNTSLIIKAVMLLLALIVMVFVASLAWFAPPDRPVDAEGLSVSTQASKEFDIAIGFKNSATDYQYVMTGYDNDFNLKSVTTNDGKAGINVLQDFSPIDVTGDGATLVRPTMQSKNKDIDRTNNSFTTVIPNKEYISYDLYFRADKECKVILDSDSFVKGAIEEAVRDGNLVQNAKTENNRKADEGNYSKDAIVGAVRVAFVNYTSFLEGEDTKSRNNSPSLLWLPRPDIHLCAKKPESDKDIEDSWTLATHVQPGDPEHYTYYPSHSDKGNWLYYDTYTHHYYSYALAEDSHIIGDINYENTVTSPDGNFVCDVNIQGEDNKFYGKTQVNIWIEGCDAEARRTMAGGMFSVNLDLAGS